MNDNLWPQVWQQLKFHQKNNDTPQQTLNRLFHEYEPTAPILAETNCRIRNELCEANKLLAAIKRHPRKNPINEKGVVVLVSYGGKEYVIDGHNRINLWLEKSNANQHEVLILEYE